MLSKDDLKEETNKHNMSSSDPQITNKTWLNYPSTEEQLNGACGGAEANGLSGAEGDGEDGGGEDEEVPVDENLFTGEDLEELDEELNTLALEDWGARGGS